MSQPKSPVAGRKTLVEEGTTFKGSLSSECPVEVKGRIDGEVTAPVLTVSAAGVVHGRVKVSEMKSEGELAGEFDAERVQLSGTVKDKTVIRAKSLEVKLSPEKGKMQVVFGDCDLEVGEEVNELPIETPRGEPTVLEAAPSAAEGADVGSAGWTAPPAKQNGSIPPGPLV
jgi:cytoskeletal protein CcmA (bactofilin family)